MPALSQLTLTANSLYLPPWVIEGERLAEGLGGVARFLLSFFGIGMRPGEVKREFPGLRPVKRDLQSDRLQIRAPEGARLRGACRQGEILAGWTQ
jgi:hypothetical protein